MKTSILAFLILFSAFSCQFPHSEEVSLFESLEKLPSVAVTDLADFSLGNEHILISGNRQAITLESIQLLSAFNAAIKTETETICLENPTSITKYPFAAKLFYPLENQGLEVSQLQIISKDKLGISLLYSIRNVDNSAKSVKFQFQANTGLQPSVLKDSTFGVNAADQIIFDELTGIFTAKDEANDWYAVWGSSQDFVVSPINSDCTPEISVLGASAGLEISLEMAGNEERVIPIFIAGSDQGEFTAIETLIDLRTDVHTDWDQNFALIDSLQSTSKITIPDQEIQEAYEWSKYKTGLMEFAKGLKRVDGGLDDSDELFKFIQLVSKDFVEKVDQEIFLTRGPRHLAPGHVMIQPLLFITHLGILPDRENRVTYIRPNLPAGWEKASIENLWIDDNQISIYINSTDNQMTVEVTQTQKKAGISIEIPDKYTKVKVLGKEVSNDTKDGFRRILMTGDHAKIEARKD
ncbi:hypothetical protein [Algoriphagus yeomjeoni]|uniref:Uncharacterized protein n=1 Tax=Algoriphagus yeomjeoni TaxID=291403 RepID=A0A327PUF7_9BACT|nr:hypothetical protein [Algoriphagus yeomjeoni]RAI94921.1 hypothetical protein LV83_00168 [Algoriphagus yeomjeoni]